MNDQSQSTVDLRDLRHYLLRHGWARVKHSNDRIELLQTRPDPTGDYSTVALPASIEFADAHSLLSEALRLIAEHEGDSVSRVLARVQRWDRDILRARTFLITGTEDSLPFDVAAETISGLRDFMGY